MTRIWEVKQTYGAGGGVVQCIEVVAPNASTALAKARRHMPRVKDALISSVVLLAESEL